MKSIYLIVAESGSGKTSIVNALEKKGYKTVNSYTTRPQRTPDETGHTFVSDEEFDALKDIVGYTEFCGYRYAATQEQVEESDMYVIDVDGVDYFLNTYAGTKYPCMIYIHSPIHTRIERMEQRGDRFSNIMERIVNDVSAFRDAGQLADVTIENGDDDSIDDVVRKVEQFMKSYEEAMGTLAREEEAIE